MRNTSWMIGSAAASSVALVVIHAEAAQYATPDQAARRSFAEATRFKETIIILDPLEMRTIAGVSGISIQNNTWRIITAYTGDKPLGVMVLDSVIGKFELIDYAVAIGNDGKICNVEILTYRESHGYEVKLSAWRKQFVGKDQTAKLRVNEDIANISGATMSSTNVTDGVRRAVALVAALKSGQRL